MNTKLLVIEDRAPVDVRLLSEAGEILRNGGLVAFPTETVYGLGGNALDPEASRKIYAAKGRPSDNPLIVHISCMEELEPLVEEIPEAALKLAERYWPGPMTMIFRKKSIVPDATSGGLPTVAIRMPSDPIAAALIRAAGVPIAAPSANASGRPSPTEARHVVEDMNGRIEMIIDGGPVDVGVESTIVDLTGERPALLRPGAVTVEMLEEILGSVEIDPVLSKPMEAGMHPKAPGMKYRHYAPKAEMILVSGEGDGPMLAIRRLSAEAEAAGKKVGIIASAENAPQYINGTVKMVGSREDEAAVAHNLFSVLRSFDEAGSDVIYSEVFPGTGIGMAVMNRMLKAAGHHEICVRADGSEEREV